MSDIKISERKLEDIFEDSFNKGNLDEVLPIRGPHPYFFRRQVNIGGYGVADIITARRIWANDEEPPDLEIFVIELKARAVEAKDFVQVTKYANGVQDYLKERGFSNCFQVRPILVCEGSSHQERCADPFFICEFSEVRCFCYDVGISGFTVEEVHDISVMDAFKRYNNE